MNMFQVKSLRKFLKFRTQLSHFALVLLTKTLGITVIETNIKLLPININIEQSKCVMTYEQANQIQLKLPINFKNMNTKINRESHNFELYTRQTKITFFEPKNRIHKNYTIYIG